MSNRKPQAITDLSSINEEQADAFFDQDMQQLDNLELKEPQKTSAFPSCGKVLFYAFVSLVLLSAISWVNNLVQSLFSEYKLLGWVALILAIVGLIALVVFIIGEIRALLRLRSVDTLRNKAATAIEHDDMNLARQAVDDLIRYTSHTSYTANGRREMKVHRQEIIDGRELIHLAEHKILKPLDLEARKRILTAAKRVSIVTAVSPRALIDLGYVLYESVRLIRNLAAIYGVRPGRFGLFSLLRRVLAHLAVTGTLAVGDGLVEQIIGQGLATRLSARLGEGVVNGLMTTRIGIAAMDALRPFPFDGEKRPGLSDFTGDLIGLKKQQTQ